VLREAAAAEGLLGGFGAVYDVFRAMEDQGRVRRGYFVAGRGATQFALPGAEERLRNPPRTGVDDEPRTVILAATDPANPWGALVPWPEVKGRTAQRAPGARVILVEGRLLAWLSRGAHHIATFLAEEEPAASRDRELLGRALANLGPPASARTTMIATIDGIASTESALAPMLAEHGFVARQGALVSIAGTARHPRSPRFGRESPPAADVGLTFDFRDGEGGEDDADVFADGEDEDKDEIDLGLPESAFSQETDA
jgi:ATP-dependent Lhr-like helicase